MKEFEDYYMILQLHHLAEPEVIEGAYKKLAKKYHPDVSGEKNADERMKIINLAYEELSDPARRRAYDLRWRAAHPIKSPAERARREPQATDEAEFTEAKAALDAYFKNIQNSYLESAYRLASGIDKQNITCDDFIVWQRAVASVFHLSEYSCHMHRAHRNKLVGGKVVPQAVEFRVDVVEHNVVMNREERDSFIKMVVLEQGEWSVYIGYQTLQPMTERFRELTDLLAAKSVVHELTERYGKRDSLTGLLNQSGLTQQIESEADRFERYGHVFSLVEVSVDTKKIGRQSPGGAADDLAIKSVGETLLANLRKTDVLGRWDETTFIALLPETKAKGASKAADKLLRKLRSKPLPATIKITAAEYRSSLRETLGRLHR